MIIIIVEQLFNFIIDHSLADNTIARQTLSFGLPITSTIPFNKNNLVILNELKLFLKTLKYKSKFVERFLELSLFYGLSSPLNSEMICIFPYF